VRSRKYRLRKKRRSTRRNRPVLRGGTQQGEPEVYQVPECPVRILIAANRRVPNLERLLNSCKKHKCEYLLYGMGEPWGGHRTGKTVHYLNGIKRTIQEKGPDTLIICVDGFDCLIVKDAAAIAESFRTKPRAMPVLFGAETGCYMNNNKDVLNWYDVHGVKGGKAGAAKLVHPIGAEYDGRAFGYTSDEPVFLNSGLIAGKASAMLALVEGMMKAPMEDDQLAACHYVLANLKDVDLDVEERLFRNKLTNRGRLPDEGKPEGPAVLHWLGSGAKEALLPYYNEFPEYERV
jgi:hypothetical protein